jgi:hypothetical protein
MEEVVVGGPFFRGAVADHSLVVQIRPPAGGISPGSSYLGSCYVVCRVAILPATV